MSEVKTDEQETPMNPDISAFVALIKSADEAALRDAHVPWPKTETELLAILRAFKEREHDYGTCVYAMSMSALAAFYLVSSWLGVTGFQASCADMDFLKRSRHLEQGFRLLDYEKLLYPQTCDEEHFPSHVQLLADKDLRKRLSAAAQKKLDEHPDGKSVHPNVYAHWQHIARLGTLS